MISYKILFLLGVRCLWASRRLFTTTDQNEPGLSSNQTDEEYDMTVKAKILAASLKYVNDLGWSQRAVSAGAESIGYPGVIHGMFRNGGVELVHYYQKTCNTQLVQQLEKEIQEISNDPSRKKSVDRFVRDALEIRLRMIVPYKKTWPQALALASHPQNVSTSFKNLLALIDDVCYYAGDRSVDFNWYTRRAAVGSIYKAAELYLLQDDTEDYQATWNFLDNSIKNVVRIKDLGANAPSPDQVLGRTFDTINAIFVTTNNLLGLGWKK